MATLTWNDHMITAGSDSWSSDAPPPPDEQQRLKGMAEPWLTALVQAEHLNLLIGSGFTTAVAYLAGTGAAGMARVDFRCEHEQKVNAIAEQLAARAGRGPANIEDQIRAARQLIDGLRILSTSVAPPPPPPVATIPLPPLPPPPHPAGVPVPHSIPPLPPPLPDLTIGAADLLARWESSLNRILSEFLDSILKTEENILTALSTEAERANAARRILGSFLLSFASRAASRERLHIFTTNYDRLVEFGCDMLGIRLLDRFVGTLTPVFRSSRLGVDLHYNPPGIRGEPRYLEGVARLTKLHGSLDWRYGPDQVGRTEVRRYNVPFGAKLGHPDLPARPIDSLMIYPNPAKDIETLEYPYADLFRDLAASICQPNCVLFSYGYGFGDDHINRAIRDMLSIPSTHLVVFCFDDRAGRVRRFCEAIGRDEQISIFKGSHAADLATLVQNYLPKPAIDRNTWRMVEILRRRQHPPPGAPAKGDADEDSEP